MKGKKLTHSALAKTIAFFLLVISALLTAGCALGAVVLAEEDFYTRSKENIIEDWFYELARSDSRTALYFTLQSARERPQTSDENTNFSFEIFDSRGLRLGGNKETQEKPDFSFSFDESAVGDSALLADESYTVNAYIDHDFPETDNYSLVNSLVGLGYSLRYAVYVVGIVCVLLALVCFVFLMFSAGHRAGKEELHAGAFVRLPLDLLAAVLLFGGFVAASLVYDGLMYSGDIFAIVLLVLGGILGLLAATTFCMNLAVRVKLGRWWENTLVYRLLMLIRRLLNALWKGLSLLFLNLPLIWRTVLFLALVMGLELLSFAAFYYDVS